MGNAQHSKRRLSSDEGDSAGTLSAARIQNRRKGRATLPDPACYTDDIPSSFVYGDDLGTRLRTTSISQHHPPANDKLPTMFTWEGGGNQACISGSFDGWKARIPMVKSKEKFYAIVELPEGTHQYKYQVDGEWKHSQNQLCVDNDMGSYNNVITVKKTDFEVFEALADDSVGTPSATDMAACTGSQLTPPGSYAQFLPPRKPMEHAQLVSPPVLPPHLLEVILNKDVPANVEPTLLPEPNHVMLNHLYALSIKDGVMVLSTTDRYKKKFVTTLLYKPINS